MGIEKINKEVTEVFDYEDLFLCEPGLYLYNKARDIQASDSVILMNGKDMRLKAMGYVRVN